MTTTEWREHLASMIHHMRDRGALTDSRWVDVFQAVPRHVFTPHLLHPDQVITDNDSGPSRHAWLSRVYQDGSLVTAVAHDPNLRIDVPTSSSTRPTLMARMLELLDVRDGMRVLEIGTGTSYNAGLLSHRLGAHNVTSIDVDPLLVDHATRALRSLNLTPHLIAGDMSSSMSAPVGPPARQPAPASGQARPANASISSSRCASHSSSPPTDGVPDTARSSTHRRQDQADTPGAGT